MAKKLVFTKSVAFEKTLIDKLDAYLTVLEGEGKRANFSGAVSELIELGLRAKQGTRKSVGDGVVRTGKPGLREIVGSHGLPVEKIDLGVPSVPRARGLRIQKL